MLCSVIATFKTDASVAARREAAREAFNDHLRQPLFHIRMAGPLHGEDGRLVGVQMLIEAESFDQIRGFVERSPYRTADLYDTIEITEWRIQVGRIA